MSSQRRSSRLNESGVTLAEVLVVLGAGTVVFVAAFTLLDYGWRVANAEDDVLEAGELSRGAASYLTSLIRQAETGVTAANPTNCVGCHVDTDGGLVNNPATDCPQDMTSPNPPIRISTFNVDPNNPATRTAAEPGNGVWFDVDRSFAPAAMNPNTVFAAERRSFYPMADPSGLHPVLQEEEDHNRDGTVDASGPVIYGLRNLSFRLKRATPPAWTVGTAVTSSCSSNPAGCHGTGNTNLGGEDIYGNGTWTVSGSPGSVWSFNHPDSQAYRGVDIEVTAASRGRTGGGQAQDFTRTLRVLAIPRRLQQ